MNQIPENNRMTKIRTTLKSRNMIKNIAGLVIGAIAGSIYYTTVGCTSGSCAITSNPYMTIIWGGLLGYLLADIIKIKEKVSDQVNESPGQS